VALKVIPQVARLCRSGAESDYVAPPFRVADYDSLWDLLSPSRKCQPEGWRYTSHGVPPTPPIILLRISFHGTYGRDLCYEYDSEGFMCLLMKELIAENKGLIRASRYLLVNAHSKEFRSPLMGTGTGRLQILFRPASLKRIARRQAMRALAARETDFEVPAGLGSSPGAPGSGCRFRELSQSTRECTAELYCSQDKSSLHAVHFLWKVIRIRIGGASRLPIRAQPREKSNSTSNGVSEE
jgi:hypothetical protein